MSFLIRPLVTEKANNEADKKGKYTFLVKPGVNKLQIKEEISRVYGVEITKVSTMIYAPKVKSKFTKAGLQVGKTNKLKKAVVSLAEGEEIDVFAAQ